MSRPSELKFEYDVVVIGAGHAGCEAALAAARTGARVLVVTPNLDRVGFMPCNPSIGGPGKRHIVAEIDALGGAMAEVAEQTAVQVRTAQHEQGPGRSGDPPPDRQGPLFGRHEAAIGRATRSVPDAGRGDWAGTRAVHPFARFDCALGASSGAVRSWSPRARSCGQP